MTNFSKNLLRLIVIVLVIGGFMVWQKQTPKELPIVRLGVVTAPHSSLVKIAIDKKFFEEEGIEVEVKEFTAGKFALPALVGGSLDLTTVADLPVTLAVLNGERLSIVSVINETVVGLPMILKKDTDAFDPQKYFSKKRKIATLVGASSEFFTSEFFKKYNIQPAQYEIVSMKPEDMPIAFARGDLDGVAIFEPFAHFAIEKTGRNEVFIIKNDDLYSDIMVLAGKTDWVSKNEKIVEKVMRALIKSESFVRSNPEEATDIVSSLTKLDKESLRSIWPTFTMQLGLHKKLISTMEKEAQWAKDTGKVPKETATPNFRDFIFDAPLKKVAPSAVEL